jgi:hypothetical protein
VGTLVSNELPVFPPPSQFQTVLRQVRRKLGLGLHVWGKGSSTGAGWGGVWDGQRVTNYFREHKLDPKVRALLGLGGGRATRIDHGV